MNVLPKDRAEKILDWLRRGGVSRRQIARELGVHRETVTKYARNSLPPETPAKPARKAPRVVVPLEVVERFDDIAYQRGMTRSELMSTVLEAVANDDLFDAVLE